MVSLPDGVHHIDCTTLDRPNVYLVEDDSGVTLVDAGWPRDEGTVREGVRDAGFSLSDVDRVLVTHFDADHVGTLHRLAPDLDAPVYVHELEADYLRGDRLPPWNARFGFGVFHRLYYRRLTPIDLPVRTVADGDAVGGFHVHHTPGHTPGHVSYVHGETSSIFLGDLAYGLGDSLRPTGRLTSYDAGLVKESIRALAPEMAGIEYACPGHGPPLDDAPERLRAAVA